MPHTSGIAAGAVLRTRRRISHRQGFLSRILSSASNHPENQATEPFLYHTWRWEGAAGLQTPTRFRRPADMDRCSEPYHKFFGGWEVGISSDGRASNRRDSPRPLPPGLRAAAACARASSSGISPQNFVKPVPRYQRHRSTILHVQATASDVRTSRTPQLPCNRKRRFRLRCERRERHSRHKIFQRFCVSTKATSRICDGTGHVPRCTSEEDEEIRPPLTPVCTSLVTVLSARSIAEEKRYENGVVATASSLLSAFFD